jgi:predicted esterase
LILSLGAAALPAGRLDTLVASDGSRAGLWVSAARPKRPLVVWLHGGLGANNPAKGLAAASNMAASWGDTGSFALLGPSAWPASPWWSNGAADRVVDLVEQAARRPGVDGSKIVLAGVSDGGSGALWLASSLRVRWGKRLKGVAIWSANPDVLFLQGLSWEPGTLRGIPLRWSAGGKDHLYPLDRIHFWWGQAKSAGIALEPHEDPLAGHDLQFHQVDLARFPGWVRRTAR